MTLRPALPLALLLLSASAFAAPPRGEDALREELRQTWIHGVHEEDARAVASESDLPTLLRLLDDPSFDRPDNAAAVLSHLAGEGAVPVLLGLAGRPALERPSPEQDRARLLLPHVLRRIAEREGGAALEGLVEIADQESFAPDLAPLAAGELERIGLPGWGLGSEPVLQPRPTAADPASRLEEAPLTYANHVDLASPMSEERLDAALAIANARLGRADELVDPVEEDVACCFEVARSGPGLTFGTTGDGLDVIDDADDFAAVRNVSSARVKVVRMINHCFGTTAPNIGGCAEYGGDSMIVIRYGGLTVEGLVWLHEFGHNANIRDHNPDSRFIMSAVTDSDNVAVSPDECAALHSPPSGTAIGLIDRGPCRDLDGDDVQDGVDNCPEEPNFDQADTDGDGVGDACEDDSDGDGVPNDEDQCPGEPDGPDTDGDGVPLCLDECPDDSSKSTPGPCGCGNPDVDSDGDGALDCLDGCASDPDKTAPGACGCGEPDDDGDGDGTADCNDGCPTDPTKSAAGACGCGTPDLDGDGNGTADCLECMLGDAWPAGGDGVVDLADYAAARRLAGLAGDAPVVSPPPCLDLAPAAAACAPDGLCAIGGDGFDADDVRVVRLLSSGTARLDCQGCEPPPTAGAALRRPGDVLPLGGAGELGDGLVDVSDVLQVLRWAVSLGDAPSTEELLRADVAPWAAGGGLSVVVGDGQVDVADVLGVLRAAVGLESLVWQERELRAFVTPATPAVAALLRVEGVPAWTSDWSASGGCEGDPSGGVSAARDLVALACAWDPDAVMGETSLGRLRYRAPEDWSGATAATVTTTAVDASLAPTASSGRLATVN